MQSLINKLFNGNTKPECEKLIDPRQTRNAKLDEAQKREEKLLTSLNEEQKEIFNKWRDCEEALWCDEIDLAYERGFKTGALVMKEVYDINF